MFTVVRENNGGDPTTIAFQRLEAPPIGGIPDLDRLIIWYRRQIFTIVREDNGGDPTTMAFQRLEAGAPLKFDSRHKFYPPRFLSLEVFSDQAACRTEYERWGVYLK